MSQDSQKKVILIAAGASGGHLMPAIAVAEELRQKNYEVIFVGVGKELERKLIPQDKFKYLVLKFEPVLGRNILEIVKLIFKTPFFLFKSLKLLRQEKVSLVIGFGGYPCFLPVLTAKILGLKTLLHEQNIHAGLANKVLAKFANKIFAPPGSSITANSNFTEILNPVRKDFYEVADWKIHNENLKILILGGSQGARNINNAILELLDFFEERSIELVHQTGKLDFEEVKGSYESSAFKNVNCQPFFENVPKILEEVDLVVSRAGAMSASEIMASRRAAIFVPLNISRGHQKENILGFVQQKQALMIKDDENLAKNLKVEIKKLDSSREEIKEVVDNITKLRSSKDKTSAEIIAESAKDLLVN